MARTGQEITYSGVLEKDAMDRAKQGVFQGRIAVAKAGESAVHSRTLQRNV